LAIGVIMVIGNYLKWDKYIHLCLHALLQWSNIWNNQWTYPRTKQLTLLRFTHSGHWWCLALCTH